MLRTDTVSTQAHVTMFCARRVLGRAGACATHASTRHALTRSDSALCMRKPECNHLAQPDQNTRTIGGGASYLNHDGGMPASAKHPSLTTRRGSRCSASSESDQLISQPSAHYGRSPHEIVLSETRRALSSHGCYRSYHSRASTLIYRRPCSRRVPV